MALTRSVDGKIVPFTDEEEAAFLLEQQELTEEIATRDAADEREKKISERVDRNNRGVERAAAIAELEAENEI